MWKHLLVLIMCLLASPGLAQKDAVDTRVCESAFEASGKWRYPDRAAFEAALTEASEKKAVQTLFAEELAAYEASVFPEERIISALRTLIRYAGSDLSVEDPLQFCMALQDCGIDSADRERFRPVEIGRVCNINEGLVRTQVEKIKEAFAEWVEGEKADGKSLDSILSMAADPERIKSHGTGALKTLVHEIDAAPGRDALSGSACLSLVVYPVEIYAATVAMEKTE